MRAIKNNEEWKGIISNQSYSNLHFNELINGEAHIINTEFKNILETFVTYFTNL
jgi:hypothetical protein